jgi:hypothetical protein
MNKLYVLLMFIALAACVACQRQQTKERKERLAAEDKAQEHRELTQRETEPNAREKAPEMTLMPASSTSPNTAPEKRNALKSQAQKFQPRRIVPMTSPIRETPASTPTSSGPPIEKLSENETEDQKSERKKGVQDGEGLSPSPTPGGKTSPVQSKVPQRILDGILKEAAALAGVTREQVVILRAEPVVWNDGSLGCPEPGMMYTQALVSGYWVVIDAAGRKHDFRVDSRGNFRLCPAGQGNPPSEPSTE